MQPSDESDRALFCFRDGTPVSAETPRCLHPSSKCDYRHLCEVVEAEREKRRGPVVGRH